MNPLLQRLAALRWKVRMLDGWKGACALLALVLGVGVVVGVADCLLHLPTLLRGAFLVGLLVGTVAVAYRFVIVPFASPCDDLNLALRIEEAHPQLNDALATTVQFLQQTKEEQERLGGSPAMRERTVQDTIARAAGCDFGKVLDWRGTTIFGVAALGVLLVGGSVIGAAQYYRPGYASIAFWRFVEPFGGHTWTRITVERFHEHENEWKAIDPSKPDRIAVGRPYPMRITLSGQLPKQARLDILGQIKSEKILEIKVDDATRTGFVATAIDMTQQYNEFKFKVTANDGSFQPRGGMQRVIVLPPPKLVDLDGQPSPHTTIYPPAYTDLPSPAKLLAGTRHVDAFEGTWVELRAKADRPLEEAWLAAGPENASVLAANLALLGNLNPIGALVASRTGDIVFPRIPAELEKDRSILRVKFLPPSSGKYYIHMRDAHQLFGRAELDVSVLRDPLPDVKLIRPTASLTAHPDAKIAFKFRVTDEFFAVRNVYVEYQKRAGGGDAIGAVKRTVLYDAELHGKFYPDLLARFGRSPLVAPVNRLRPQDLGKEDRFTVDDKKNPMTKLRLRPKDLDFETVWHLNNEFKVGDHVTIQVCAEDFCDLYGAREAGKSHSIDLQIVSKEQLVRDAGVKLEKIRDAVKHAADEQKKAMDAIKKIQKADMFGEAEKQAIIAAEQAQREIQDQIGKAPDQGLRKELADIRQELKNNDLTNTKAFEQAGAIKGTLDHIAQRDLDKATQKVAEARDEVNKNDKKSPQTDKKLEDTANAQKPIVNALNDLVKQQDPQQTVQRDMRALEDLRNQQAQLNEKLEELRTDKQNQDQDPNLDKKQIEKNFREQVAQKAKEQRDIAQKMEKLIQDMKADQKQLEADGAKKEADQLQKAIEQLEPKQQQKPDPKKPQDPVNAQMKDAAKQLDNKSEAPQKALDQQKDIVKNIDDAIGKLEDKKLDVDRQALKDRQDAEKRVDELRKENKKIQEEAAKAQMIENLEERLMKQKEIAEKLGNLQDRMEKLERELARLQEQKAADALQKAQEEIANAKKQIEMGGDPQPNEKKADEELKNAKRDLQQAEEELAREMLIKFHDRLKADKGRQDALIERSENLHKKIIRDKSWRDSYLDTITGNIDGQKAVGEETELLHDKIKEAKVFADILKRAKESMDTAEKTMDGRRELGKERRYAEKDGDERMDAKELKDEEDSQGETIRNQKDASKRLDRLLDALKEELARKPQAPPEPPDDPGGDEQPPQRGQQNADGIPPTAQIKALKLEQLDLNDRTEDFARQNPGPELTDAQKKQFRDLEMEQQRLSELFQELVAQMQPPMPQPMPEPKQGEKK